MRAFKVLMVGALLAVGLGAPAAAHGPDDGRIPGKPDVHKVGKELHVFEKEKGTYRIERKGQPDMTLHHHPPAAELANAGPALPLAQHEVVPWCVSSGHRIVPVYVRLAGNHDPAMPDLIRSIVRRMNWKFMQESLLSSDSTRQLRMVVECNQWGNIAVREVDGNSRQHVEAQLGTPQGRHAVKYLAFNEACLDGSDANSRTGESSDPRRSLKSASDDPDVGNYNRVLTTTAMVNAGPKCPAGDWQSHVTVHELIHLMGGAHLPTWDWAPFATRASHCTDGLDVLCYGDGSGPGQYSETRCPANGYYNTPDGVPVDCGYDTYFDAAPESGEWLTRFWNVAGHENPYLSDAQPSDLAPTAPRFQVADVQGDGRAEVIGKKWLDSENFHYAEPSKSFQGSIGFGSATSAYAPFALADVNGNGTADLVGRNAAGNVQVKQAGGGGYQAPVSWGTWASTNSMQLADVTGDAKADLVGVDGSGVLRVGRSTGTAFQAAAVWGSWSSTNGPLKLADVNGDGLHDVVGVSATGDVRVGLSNGSSFAAAALWGSVAPDATVMFGDVTGDGKHDMVTLSPTNARALHTSSGSSFGAGVAKGGWWTGYSAALADFNGDGRADMIGRSTTGPHLRVALATVSSSGWANDGFWGTWSHSYSMDAADVDADGRADLVGRNPTTDDLQVAYPKGLDPVVEQAGWNPAFSPFQAADVTGDGDADLLGRNSSTGQIGKASVSWGSLGAFSTWGSWSGLYTPWRLGDVNGDGKADIVGHRAAANDVQVGLSTGSTFAGSTSWTWWGADWAPIHVADVTGDGKADLIGRSNTSGAVAVGPSTGSSFAGANVWATWATSWGPLRIADINGDGRGDLVSLGGDGLVRAALSNGSSFGYVQVWTWWGGAYADYQLADMNGDGRADLVARNASTGDLQVALSNGSKFLGSASWGTWADAIASS